jgi:SAM-dependent methyltransferase
MLDVGCGELTTLSIMVNRLLRRPKSLYAFDVSWSRIFHGLDFYNNHSKKTLNPDPKLFTFSADIEEIPLPDKSIDITTSSYALYSSRGRLDQLLFELFRVTKRKLVLFEPSYELATKEGKSRMDSLLYIKNFEISVNNCGGIMEDIIPILKNTNPLTPTACYVIKPPVINNSITCMNNFNSPFFTYPGSNNHLTHIDNFLFCELSGYCFPILKNIPILRSKSKILASALLTSAKKVEV